LRSAELGRVGIQLVADSGIALLVLLATTTLAVYKPWGMTRYGRRKQHDDTGVRPDRESTTGTPRWVKIFGIIAFVLVMLFVILHLTGRGLGGH
jgi:ABC-type Fe3+ transport system permease subunit